MPKSHEKSIKGFRSYVLKNKLCPRLRYIVNITPKTKITPSICWWCMCVCVCVGVGGIVVSIVYKKQSYFNIYFGLDRCTKIAY